jgi:hypothetical protein
MAPPRSIDGKNVLQGAIPAVTPWTFIRAAGLANLLVATLVVIEFSVIALVQRDGRALHVGLCLVLFAMLVVCGASAVLGVVALTPGRLWRLGRRLIGPARSSPPDKSGVWDDWLDNPEPRDS